ncbi:hypothetical protein [Nocardia carnea]|uniref:hypothetical protein n=1 Tax=Nocardia carnea TaxID=37328 RepID=UPI00245559D9|nr:hypothetical protein [Nocardia carnea]
MPHVEIWHQPAELSEPARRRLETEIVTAVARAYGVAEGVVSIGTESVPAQQWDEQVYRPRITERGSTAGNRLLRSPDY